MWMLGADRGYQRLLTIVGRSGMNTRITAHRGILAIGTNQQFCRERATVLQLDVLPVALQLEGIIMTMYDKRTNLSRQVAKEVRDHFGDVLYDTFIPRSIRLSEAPSYGKAVVEYDPHSSGAIAYRHLAREFVRRREAEAAATPG